MASTIASVRPRWLIPVVGAVILLAIGIGIVVAMTLTGARQAGAPLRAASYAPADTTMFSEVRLDLPGDQRANLRAFLGHFSQVAADKYLTDELDAQLDALTASASPAFAYSKDVKPWFDGTVAVAMVGYPSLNPTGTPAIPDVLVFAGVKDQQAASALSDRVRAEITNDGTSVTSSTHGGQTVWSAHVPTGLDGPGSVAPSWTVTSDEVVFGTSADLVGRALDAHGATNMAGRQDFRDAVARLPADRVGTTVIDTKALLAAMRQQVDKAEPSMGPLFDTLINQGQLGLVAEGVRFENDRFVGDATLGGSGTLPANGDRGLAALTPGDAYFFADGGDVGKGLEQFVRGIKVGLAASGGSAQQLDQVDAVLGGDLESFVSWVGDAALVAGSSDGQPYAGMIATTTDANAARTKLGQLQSLLQLAAQGGGPRVNVSQADHNGTTITTLQLEATNGVPPWISAFQYAVTDQRVVLGTGQTFVARVLDMQQGDSLAAQSRYGQAMDSVGGQTNLGGGWLDLTGLRTAIEPMLPPDTSPLYRTLVKPWLTPFDYVVWGQRTDGSYIDSNAAIVVK